VTVHLGAPPPTVRTRVAPSPTGDPHVGTAYVALVNAAFARRSGGAFLLRIEDTDRARSTPASERVILEALRWLGLAWDEGPDVGGPHGPYRQSERLELYAAHAARLLASGHAFRCFCTPQRLDAMRAEQRAAGRPPAYDGLCLRRTQADVEARLAAGEPHVVRMTVPSEGVVTIDDLLRGPVEIDLSTVDMQILVKSDGWPTYHLANVVDDHLMGITHVLRGEEWIPSAPKHLLLYRAFGWEMPKLGHLPLLRNADRSKLSKRKNPTSILFYERMGYLPEALTNFLGLLTISSGGEDEMMDLGEIARRLDLGKMSLAGPVFDVAKLDWLNGRYLNERLDDRAFGERVRAWALNPGYLERIAPLARGRVKRLSDLGPLVAFFFSGGLDVSAEDLHGGRLEELPTRQMLACTMWALDALETYSRDAIDASVRALCERLGVKLKDATRPLYVAVTGSAQSVPLFDSIAVLGRDLVRERLRRALALLGAPSAREQTAWQAAYLAERVEETA